jgi:hypothetical protein
MTWMSQHPPSHNEAQAKRIQRARIIVVPPQRLAEAISLLDTVSLVPLDATKVEHLLDGHVPTEDEVIANVIADADSEARMFMGTPPEESIAYARTLKGKLQPYLVRAVAVNLGTGSFDVRLAGEELSVFHGSLGSGNFRKTPIVIFLERQPTNVWVNAGAAL